MEVPENYSPFFAGDEVTDTELEDTTDDECDSMPSSEEELQLLPLSPDEMETEGIYIPLKNIHFCTCIYRFIKSLFLG